jgi:hypothetical protein
MAATDCRVWHLYQARCLLCDWSEEVTGDPGGAAYGASVHRASSEHLARLRERRKRAQPSVPDV